MHRTPYGPSGRHGARHVHHNARSIGSSFSRQPRSCITSSVCGGGHGHLQLYRAAVQDLMSMGYRSPSDITRVLHSQTRNAQEAARKAQLVAQPHILQHYGFASVAELLVAGADPNSRSAEGRARDRELGRDRTGLTSRGGMGMGGSRNGGLRGGRSRQAAAPLDEDFFDEEDDEDFGEAYPSREHGMRGRRGGGRAMQEYHGISGESEDEERANDGW